MRGSVNLTARPTAVANCQKVQFNKLAPADVQLKPRAQVRKSLCDVFFPSYGFRYTNDKLRRVCGVVLNRLRACWRMPLPPVPTTGGSSANGVAGAGNVEEMANLTVKSTAAKL